MNVLIAIDPGASGGIVVQAGNDLKVQKMPETMTDICDVLRAAKEQSETLVDDGVKRENSCFIRCYMERVGGYIGGQGQEEGKGQPGSAMFNFGCNYGAIQGMMVALKIPFELVTPQTWQKGLGVGSKGLQRAVIIPGMTPEARRAEFKRVQKVNYQINKAWKNKLKSLAQQIYPFVQATLETSDCLLILEYARRRELVSPALTAVEVRSAHSFAGSKRWKAKEQPQLL